MPPELTQQDPCRRRNVLDLPQTREFFQNNSFERVGLSPAQFGELIEKDFRHWDALIKAVGAKIE